MPDPGKKTFAELEAETQGAEPPRSHQVRRRDRRATIGQNRLSVTQRGTKEKGLGERVQAPASLLKRPGVRGTGPVFRGTKNISHADDASAAPRPTERVQPARRPVAIDDDPRRSPAYIERAIVAVSTSIIGGPYLLFRTITNGEGRDWVTLPRQFVYLESDPLRDLEIRLNQIYPSREAAENAIAKAHTSGLYTFYRGLGGFVYPTVISDTTAPSLCAALRMARKTEIENAGLIEKGAGKLAAWYLSARFPFRIKAPSAAAIAKSEATALVQTAKQRTGRVVLNLGGAGERAEAINVNPLVGQQVKDIPNLVKAPAETIAKLFGRGTVDEIIANNIVHGQVNWTVVAKAAFRILKRGGNINIVPYAGGLDAHLGEIVSAFEAAGFKDVIIEASRYVIGLRP